MSRKFTNAELAARVRRLELDLSACEIALTDVARLKTGKHRRGRHTLLLCRLHGAHGGVVVHKTADWVSAYYWEEWFERVRSSVPRHDDKDGQDLYNLAHEAKRYIDALRAPTHL